MPRKSRFTERECRVCHVVYPRHEFERGGQTGHQCRRCIWQLRVQRLRESGRYDEYMRKNIARQMAKRRVRGICPPRRVNGEARCFAKGCKRKATTVSGYCGGHYQRMIEGRAIDGPLAGDTAKDQSGVITKACTRCREYLPLDRFSVRNGNKKDGRNNYCRACSGDLKRESRLRNLPRELTAAAIRRARDLGRDCDLSVDDPLPIPKRCPVLGIELRPRGPDRDHCATIDRIDNSRGYTRDNVAVISNRANRIKSDASADELETIARWIRLVAKKPKVA